MPDEPRVLTDAEVDMIAGHIDGQPAWESVNNLIHTLREVRTERDALQVRVGELEAVVDNSEQLSRALRQAEEKLRQTQQLAGAFVAAVDDYYVDDSPTLKRERMDPALAALRAVLPKEKP